MGYKLKLEITGFQDFSVEIKAASAVLDDNFSQCWCVELIVYWQTISIDGWAFLSIRWGELLFERVPTCPPPHFISGKSIETESDNDMLRELADDIGAPPEELAVAIFKTLGDVMFIMPPLRLIGNEITIDAAMSYRYGHMIHRI